MRIVKEENIIVGKIGYLMSSEILVGGKWWLVF